MAEPITQEALPIFDVGPEVVFGLGSLAEANGLLVGRHYLGPLPGAGGARLIVLGRLGTRVVGCMIWRHPSARYLPNDGSWLELSRWCLTADCGPNAGSRMHKAAVRLIREQLPEVTTLVSYSDPSVGHTGALYKACNWAWEPTWHRLSPPPTGAGDWGTGKQEPKDRWVFRVRKDRMDWATKTTLRALLDCHPEPLAGPELLRSVHGANAQTVGGVLEELARRGWLEREQEPQARPLVPGSRRLPRRFYRLTDDGAESAQAALAAVGT